MINPFYLNRFFLLLVCYWLFFIMFHGIGHDEVQHTHVAWLMGVKGLRPFDDFFEHHMPIIWELLTSYFWLGGEGLGIVYYGRFLATLCCLMAVWGLHQFGKHTATNLNQKEISLPGYIAIVFLIFSSTILSNLFTMRPEVVATPLFIWSCITWSKANDLKNTHQLLYDFLTGIMFGLAILFSPRFLLLGGIYILLTNKSPLVFFQDFRRYINLSLGTISIFFLYVFISDFTFYDLHFALSFSSLLQKIGNGNGIMPEFIFFFAALAITITITYTLGNSENLPGKNWELVYLLIVLLLSYVIAGNYVYYQDAIAIIVLCAIMLARGQARIDKQGPLLVLCFGILVAQWTFFLRDQYDFVTMETNIHSQLKERSEWLNQIPPGEKILLTPNYHMVTVDDASFYYLPLLDAPDRVCRAVKAGALYWHFPDCNYLADIKKHRPYYIHNNEDGELQGLINEHKHPELENYVLRNYVDCGPFMVRKDESDMDPPVEPFRIPPDPSETHPTCLRFHQAKTDNN